MSCSWIIHFDGGKQNNLRVSAVLSLEASRWQKPSAIQTILQGYFMKCNQRQKKKTVSLNWFSNQCLANKSYSNISSNAGSQRVSKIKVLQGAYPQTLLEGHVAKQYTKLAAQAYTVYVAHLGSLLSSDHVIHPLHFLMNAVRILT